MILFPPYLHIFFPDSPRIPHYNPQFWFAIGCGVNKEEQLWKSRREPGVIRSDQTPRLVRAGAQKSQESTNPCHFLPHLCARGTTECRWSTTPRSPSSLEQDVVGSSPFCFSPPCKNRRDDGDAAVFYEPPALPEQPGGREKPWEVYIPIWNLYSKTDLPGAAFRAYIHYEATVKYGPEFVSQDEIM